MSIKFGSLESQNLAACLKKRISKTLSVILSQFLTSIINLPVYVQEREEINKIERNKQRPKNLEIIERSIIVNHIKYSKITFLIEK
jgi:hypothetical protein